MTRAFSADDTAARFRRRRLTPAAWMMTLAAAPKSCSQRWHFQSGPTWQLLASSEAHSRAMWQMIALLAEPEPSLIIERTHTHRYAGSPRQRHPARTQTQAHPKKISLTTNWKRLHIDSTPPKSLDGGNCDDSGTHDRGEGQCLGFGNWRKLGVNWLPGRVEDR